MDDIVYFRDVSNESDRNLFGVEASSSCENVNCCQVSVKKGQKFVRRKSWQGAPTRDDVDERQLFIVDGSWEPLFRWKLCTLVTRFNFLKIIAWWRGRNPQKRWHHCCPVSSQMHSMTLGECLGGQAASCTANGSFCRLIGIMGAELGSVSTHRL